MEVAGSKLAAGLMAEQVYLCQGVWSLLVDIHRAVETLFISNICMKMFDGRDKVGFDSPMCTVETQPKGTSLRIVGPGECISTAEDLTEDVKFMNGPDTNVRISSAIEMSLAATSKDEGESEDDKDEDEDDDNEEDFGEEEGEEDVSSEDGGEENNGVDEPEGGGGDEEEEDEDDDANDNNENDGSDDDDEEDDDDDEVVEEEDDHAEGDEEEDDEGEDKDEKEEDEDEEDEESLHPSKKRKK